MDLALIAKATTKTLISYLTYQAVRVILAQLYETDPPTGLWLNQFSTTSAIQDGEVYLQELMIQRRELALRVMTVRAHLADEVAEFLPEMTKAGIQEANRHHQLAYLQRITALDPSQPPTDS